MSDYRCDRFKDRVGYKGQRYAVIFADEDGKNCLYGWQNESDGGLANSARLHPGWSNVRVVRVIGTCDKRMYEHNGAHAEIHESGQKLPPFPCENWQPILDPERLLEAAR